MYHTTHAHHPFLIIPPRYMRADGTLAYFFSTADLEARATAAGFATEECKYACVVVRNRKKGQDMKRVFVNAVFVKPEDEEGSDDDIGAV